MTPAKLSRPVSAARARALLQHVYPQRLLGVLMHRATRVRFRPWKNWQIRWFIRRYGVDMSEALLSDAADYPDFNSFFTRELRPGIRPFDGADDAVASPADGKVGQFGRIRDDVLVQAKGLKYSLTSLLGGVAGDSAEFRGGGFVTIYLAPRNYHRVHMPLDGVLRKSVQVPGRLFSVGAETTRWVPNLFTRNERVVSFFDHPRGSIAIVMVGALFVGGIERAWSDPADLSQDRSFSLSLRKAEEMGRFNMGSTVVVLFAPSLGIEWAAELHPDRTIRFGERIGTLAPKA